MKNIKNIWLDGEVITAEAGKVGAMTHSFHYGSTVFEGIRVYDGKAFKLQQHHERLLNSAKLVGYEIPYSIKELNEATEQLIAKEGIKFGYVRSFAWRGDETMLVSAEGCKIHTAIAVWESFENMRAETRKIGARVEISRWCKPPAASYPYAAKVASNYTMATLIKNEAVANGYDDALVLDGDGFITEGTTANFFIIHGKQLLTPIADCFLNGITRQTIIELAAKGGLTAIEGKFGVDELAAESAFFTGTAIEIMPIREIVTKDNTYQYDIDNIYLKALREEYHKLCYSIT